MKKANKYKAFWYCGYKIEYSKLQKRWFVCDWDYENGFRDIGPSHANKNAAMNWCDNRGI